MVRGINTDVNRYQERRIGQASVHNIGRWVKSGTELKVLLA